jgi:hypothetical protein
MRPRAAGLTSAPQRASRNRRVGRSRRCGICAWRHCAGSSRRTSRRLTRPTLTSPAAFPSHLHTLVQQSATHAFLSLRRRCRRCSGRRGLQRREAGDWGRRPAAGGAACKEAASWVAAGMRHKVSVMQMWQSQLVIACRNAFHAARAQDWPPPTIFLPQIVHFPPSFSHLCSPPDFRHASRALLESLGAPWRLRWSASEGASWGSGPAAFCAACQRSVDSRR